METVVRSTLVAKETDRDKKDTRRAIRVASWGESFRLYVTNVSFLPSEEMCDHGSPRNVDLRSQTSERQKDKEREKREPKL